MNNILESKWSDVFTENELNTLINFFTDKHKRYTDFYKKNTLTSKDVDDMNKFLMDSREKRLSKIPNNIPKLEKLRLRRIIIRETRPYTGLEVASQSNANEYIRWVNQINSDDKINTTALFEYICFTENEPERCDKKMIELARKTKTFRNKYVDLQSKLLKEKKKRKVKEGVQC